MPAPRRKRRVTVLLYVLAAVAVAALAVALGFFERLALAAGEYEFAGKTAKLLSCPQTDLGSVLNYVGALGFGALVALVYALVSALAPPQVRPRARFALIVALLAGLSLYHWRFPLGIDLAGGAFLNYRFDTSEIDRRIGELRADLAEAETDKARQKRAEGLKKLREKLLETPGEEQRKELEGEIDKLENAEARLHQQIANEGEKRKGSAEQALKTVRERLDPTGTEGLVIARRGEREFTVTIPMKPVRRLAGESWDDYQARRTAIFRADLETRIKPIIERQGILNFYEVVPERDPAVEQARKTGEPGEGFLLLPQRPGPRGEEMPSLLVHKAPIMGGEGVGFAQPEMRTEGTGGWAVSLRLTGAGTHAFDAAAARLYHEDEKKAGRVAIVLDGVAESDPRIRARSYRGHAEITGNFKRAEAESLSKILNGGSLKLKARFQSESVIGPSLGADQVQRGRRAALIGGAVVLAFMALYYLFSGLVANLALVLNVLLILASMAFLKAPLTLPGLAGIVLTIGMAVDANVLINERIREEKARGRALRLAVQAGYERALVTIIDANVTTLITGYILYLFGSGPVRGFAVTLCLGILASMFTAIFVTRIVVDLAIGRGWATELRMLRLFGASRVPFLRTAPLLVLVSVLALVGSVWSLATTRSERLWGIDFLGGTETQLNFAGETDIDEVREGVERVRARLAEALARAHAGSAEGGGSGPLPPAAGEEAAPEETAPPEALPVPPEAGDLYSPPEWRAILEACRTRDLKRREIAGGFTVQTFQPTGPGVSKEFRVVTSLNETEVRLLKLESALKAEFGPRLDRRNPIPYTATVGGQVADQMLSRATMALLFSLVAIFFYIVFRFEFNPAFGLAAIVALCHDTIIALAACVLFEVRIDLTIIAALLTVIGYSLNDTIIVFDRIRENRGAARRPFGEIADQSLNQVLGRTVLTSVTTLAALVALLVWGGGVIRGFAVVMTVGVLVGTYSSIFIATPFVALWERLRARGGGRGGADGRAAARA